MKICKNFKNQNQKNQKGVIFSSNNYVSLVSLILNFETIIIFLKFCKNIKNNKIQVKF